MSKTATTMPVHALCLVFPRPTEAERTTLRESLQLNGQREDIVLLNGEILDGLSRYEECTALKITPRFREFGTRETDGASPARFVSDMNITHRHLTPGQRAAAAEELIPFYEAEALTKTEATNVVAGQFNVSASSVKTASKVKKTDSQGFDRVKRGEKTLNKAATEAEAKRQADLEAAEATLLKQDREKHAKTLTKELKDEAFVTAFSNGTILKTKADMDDFIAMDKEDKKLIKELIIRAWKPKAALKFMTRSLDGKDTLESLVLQQAGVEKTIKVAVNGFIVTARKATAGD